MILIISIKDSFLSLVLQLVHLLTYVKGVRS